MVATSNMGTINIFCMKNNLLKTIKDMGDSLNVKQIDTENDFF